MKIAIRAPALTAAFAVLPVSASAVYVGSYHGDGNQYRAVTYDHGARVDGRLGSIQGYPVYYEGKSHFTGVFCPNEIVVGRYTSNTSATYYVPRGGAITTSATNCISDSVRSRVSRDITFAPDPSGRWSAAY